MSQPRIYRRTPASRTPFEALHEMAISFAEEEFGRKGQIPFLWLLDLDDEILWIETPWENDAEKDAMVRLMRILLRESKARAYSNMIEAWMAKATTLPKDDPNFVMPSDRPKSERDDVLMVNSHSRNGDQFQTRYLVTIRKHGPNFLGPRIDEDFKNGIMEGRMFNLLRDPKCEMCGQLMGHKNDCVAESIALFFTRTRASAG